MAKKQLKFNLGAGLTKTGIISGIVVAGDMGLNALNGLDAMQNAPGEDGTISPWNLKKIGVASALLLAGAATSAVQNEHVSNVGAGVAALGALHLKNQVVAGVAMAGLGSDKNKKGKERARKYVSLYDKGFNGDALNLAAAPVAENVVTIGS